MQKRLIPLREWLAALVHHLGMPLLLQGWWQKACGGGGTRTAQGTTPPRRHSRPRSPLSPSLPPPAPDALRCPPLRCFEPLCPGPPHWHAQEGCPPTAPPRPRIPCAAQAEVAEAARAAVETVERQQQQVRAGGRARVQECWSVAVRCRLQDAVPPSLPRIRCRPRQSC